jgi:Zn-dependent peptidase ImmA (M78 family)
MFILAREARGLTQSQLAERLGVAQGAVSKVENGVQSVSEEILAAYVRELRFLPAFFDQDLEVRSLPVHFWRKKARVSVHTGKTVAARMNILRLQLKALLRSANVPENRVPTLDRSAFRGGPADAARLVRERWFVPRGPIRDLVALLEDHGVVVIQCDFETEDVDAISMFDASDDLPPIILVNPNSPGDRLRWSLAHELGHLVLHAHHNYVPDQETETEADEFAGEFTMPTADIRSHLRVVTLEQLATLKLTWKMSIGSLVMKAKNIGAISDYRCASLWKEINFRGWKMREPNPIPREKATLIGEIISFHRDDLAYSDAQLEQSLMVFAPEIRSNFTHEKGPMLRRVK